MKAYCIDHFGSVDGVVLQSRADPQPGRREILVRVGATSLNYRDLMVLKGGGRGPTKVGVVPLSDGAGEFEHFRRYPWVLNPYRYESQEQLIGNLADRVISPAEAKVLEIRGPMSPRQT
jgi:hypothetical protein